jgi:hypothetical protein
VHNIQALANAILEYEDWQKRQIELREAQRLNRRRNRAEATAQKEARHSCEDELQQNGGQSLIPSRTVNSR